MPHSKHSLRILLVEDNPGDAYLACEHLADMPSDPPTVEVAGTLAHAIRSLELGRVDAIVLDLNLPDSQGMQTLRSIRAAAGNAPIIVVSGQVDDDLRLQAVREGAEDVFDKRETKSRLFSRSVLLVVERNRARGRQLQLLALLDATPDAIVVIGQEGDILFSNAAAVELIGKHDELLDARDSVFASDGAEPIEMLLDCHRTPTACEVRITPLDWGGQMARLASIRDMTVQNQTELLKRRGAELERQNQQVCEASRRKSDFLANMSHEIRTPMNAVIGLSYLLERTRLDPVQLGYVNKVKLASKALLSIISNVLDFSKIEAGELSIERAPFRLRDLLLDTSGLIAVQASAKGVDFVVDVSPALPDSLEGDATRIYQVLTNLLSNGVKFTDRGAVRLTVRPVQQTDQQVRVRFVVSDSGVGIAPEALTQVFKPFVQADDSTTRRFGGTGLGLSIVRELVGLMGGTVHAVSSPGVGSEFSVELDLPIGEHRALPALKASESAVGGRRLVGARLLVVDDSSINLEVAQRILEGEGATVRLARNGQEALDHLLAAPDAVDAVLMDVQMPVLDGNDATRRIRNGLGLQDLPIIALTAGALTSERQLAEAAGMNDFLSKPFDPDALVNCLCRHLRIARAVDRVRAEVRSPAAVWPHIDGIDSADVSRRLGGDLKLFSSLLRRMFSTCFSGDLVNPPTAVALARLHEIKGVAGTLGAKGIAATAHAAETAVRSSDAEQAGRLIRRLIQDVRQLEVDALAVLAPSKPPASDPAPLSQRTLAHLLRSLRSSALSATGTFESVAPQLRRALGDKTFVTTQSQIEGLEFEAAANTLERLVERIEVPGIAVAA